MTRSMSKRMYDKLTENSTAQNKRKKIKISLLLQFMVITVKKKKIKTLIYLQCWLEKMGVIFCSSLLLKHGHKKQT